jgi:hypothetical protein
MIKSEVKSVDTGVEELLRHLREGELNKAVAIQRKGQIDLGSIRTSAAFVTAIRQCVEIRMLLPGMTPGKVLEKARILAGDMDFSAESALLSTGL